MRRRYISHGHDFRDHKSVNHKQEEWVSRTDKTVHTQTIESLFSVFKRGMKGVYQHASMRHLHRYAGEFNFRYSNRIAPGIDDKARADNLLKGVAGKRLTYQTANRQEETN